MVFITKEKMEKKKNTNSKQNKNPKPKTKQKTKPEQKHNCGVTEALAVCSLRGPDIGVGDN